MADRAYKWSFAELVDRLTIVTQKVIYADTPEMKASFIQERADIIHDLNLFLQEGVTVDGDIISHICALQHINTTIWKNESAFRGDGDGGDLVLTHSLNSDRAFIKKIISTKVNGRVDHKLNYNKGILDFGL